MNAATAFVLDASVLVARIRRNEDGHADARMVLAVLATQRVPVYVPAIAFAEVAAAISRGAGSKRWAAKAVSDLRGLPGLQIAVVDERLGAMAAEIAAEYRIRGCDAVYVALAAALDAGLITLDREQRERSPHPIAVFSPGEILAIGS